MLLLALKLIQGLIMVQDISLQDPDQLGHNKQKYNHLMYNQTTILLVVYQ